MEAASLGVGIVGLAGLVSACLDLLDRVDDYKAFENDSSTMSLCFDADKHRFRQWLLRVGIVNGHVAEVHHPSLDDAELAPLVYKILAAICKIWGMTGGGSGKHPQLDVSRDDVAAALGDTDGGRDSPSQPFRSLLQGTTRQKLADKTNRVGWALGRKAKFMKQLEAFEALVNRLYSLIPPAQFSKEPAVSASIDSEASNSSRENDEQHEEQRRVFDELKLLLKLEVKGAVDKWLGHVVFSNHHFDKCLSTRLADTCGWIFKKEAFRDWASSDFPGDTSKILWINGPAGYGKTVLCAHIIQELKGAPAPSTSLTEQANMLGLPVSASKLAYFFFSADLEARGDPLVIVRSWVAQLIASNADALDHALSRLPTSEAGTATATEIWSLFSLMVREVKHCTLVVDGLDECAASPDYPAMYDRFTSESLRAIFLAQVMQAVAKTQTRVLIVSRDERDIRTELRPGVDGGVSGRGFGAMATTSPSDRVGNHSMDLSKVMDSQDIDADNQLAARSVVLSECRISAGEVKRDVALFASSIIDKKLPNKDIELRKVLAKNMAISCQGMFLWMRQQAIGLRSGRNRRQLLEVVQQKPPGLDRLYDANWAELQRLDHQDRVRALAILRWTTFAVEPLTVGEITHALVINNEDEERDDFADEELPDEVDHAYVDDQIVDICRSLVEVRPDGRSKDVAARYSLHLAHFSVREYLLSVAAPARLDGIDSIPFSDKDAQQAHLARLCGRYLSYGKVWEPNRDVAFLHYAASAWFRHTGPHMKSYPAVTGIISKFFDAHNPRWELWRDYYEKVVPSASSTPAPEQPVSGSRLYYAALFGLIDTVVLLCRQPSADVNAAGGRLGTALQAAASGGHVPVMEYLCDCGADVNCLGGAYGSALNAAVVNGHDDAVSALLQKGADCGLRDPQGLTALYSSSAAGHARMVAQLIRAGADVTAANEAGQTALHAAAEFGHCGIVEHLLDAEADVNALSETGETPIYLAALNGHQDTVKLLLSRGANVKVGADSYLLPTKYFQQLTTAPRPVIESNSSQDVIKWLGQVRMDGHNVDNECRTARVEGTCFWVVGNRKLIDWVSPVFSDKTAKILWINGPAGYGKTTLCAYIIQLLTAIAGQPHNTTPSISSPPSMALAYFFFSFDIQPRGDPLVVVRSWLAQLVAQHREALLVALKYEPQIHTGTAKPEEIWEIFGAVTRVLQQCVLIVDGLDECVKLDAVPAVSNSRFSSENRIANFLSRLKEALAHTTTRVLVVSRDVPDVRSVLCPAENDNSSSPTAIAGVAERRYEDDKYHLNDARGSLFVATSEFSISADDVRSDLRVYARSVVEQILPEEAGAQQDYLAALIADKANGQFLWIRLLHRQCVGSGLNSQQLQDKVRQISPGLNAMYDQVWSKLLRLKGPTLCRALAILRWSLFALRPLPLQALTKTMVGINDDDCNDLDCDDQPVTLEEESLEDIVNILSPFIWLRPEDAFEGSFKFHTCHLVHFSVIEYLMSVSMPLELSSINSVPFHNIAAQHLYLARLCLRYLLRSSTWESELTRPFLTYASFAWYLHVTPRAIADQAFTGLVDRLFDIENSCWDRWQEHRRTHVGDGFGTKDQEITLFGSRLYVAAVLGLLKVVCYLCSQPDAEVNILGGVLGSPLQAAAAQGFLPVVQYLLDRGANVNAVGGNLGSALHAAVAKGHEDVVRHLLLQPEADVSLDGPKEQTALLLAVKSRNTPIATLVLDAGGHDFRNDMDGYTPLVVAARSGNFDMVKLLLDRGANVDEDSRLLDSSLYLAAWEGHTKVVNQLLERGANIDNVNRTGWTPLNIASINGRFRVVKHLLAYGADHSLADSDALTPLNYATMYGFVGVVKLLLEHGADIEAPSNQGWRPLNSAASYGHLEMVRLFLERGANLSHADAEGRTPLNAAAVNGHVEVVRLLLEHGEGLEEPDVYGFTPLNGAAAGGAFPVFPAEEEWQPRNVAFKTGHAEVVELLLERGASVATPSNDGSTPLHSAASSGRVDIAGLLIECGSPLDAPDDDGCTPLHFAARNGHSAVVRLLLERGAKSEVRDNDNRTPLISAYDMGHDEAVQVLLELAPCPAVTKFRGLTPPV